MAKRSRQSKSANRIDLHGMRVEEAIAAVTRHIDRALLNGVHRLEIVHGLGTGKLQGAVHQYLRSLSVVESFKLDDVNPGVTLVYL